MLTRKGPWQRRQPRCPLPSPPSSTATSGQPQLPPWTRLNEALLGPIAGSTPGETERERPVRNQNTVALVVGKKIPGLMGPPASLHKFASQTELLLPLECIAWCKLSYSVGLAGLTLLQAFQKIGSWPPPLELSSLSPDSQSCGHSCPYRVEGLPALGRLTSLVMAGVALVQTSLLSQPLQ